MQSVIRALEFYDLVPPRGGPSQADGVHCGFGAAVAEAAHLNREAPADFFREFPLHVVRHAEHGAGGEAFFNGLHHRGMAMSCHERAESQIMVDVFVAIQIAELAAAGFFHEDGPGFVVAIIAGYAERNAFEIFLVGFGGFRGATLEGCEFFLQIGIHQFSGETQAGGFLVKLRAIRMPERRAVRGVYLV